VPVPQTDTGRRGENPKARDNTNNFFNITERIWFNLKIRFLVSHSCVPPSLLSLPMQPASAVSPSAAMLLALAITDTVIAPIDPNYFSFYQGFCNLFSRTIVESLHSSSGYMHYLCAFFLN
jgi:hypothetical protein